MIKELSASSNTVGLRKARADDSRAKMHRVESVLSDMVARGDDVVGVEIARRANVSRWFLSSGRQGEIRGLVDQARIRAQQLKAESAPTPLTLDHIAAIRDDIAAIRADLARLTQLLTRLIDLMKENPL